VPGGEQLRLAVRLEPEPGDDLGVRERRRDGVVDRAKPEAGADRLAHVDLGPGGPARIVRPERQLALDPLRREERVVDHLDVEVGVAFALASKRLSITASNVTISSGWAIERTIFPAGSMTYTVGMPFVLYEFLRLSPPVKIGHVIPVEFTYVELIVSAEAPVVSMLRN